MIIFLLLIAGAVPPADGTVEDRVDIIELNTAVNRERGEILDQWIFWEWDTAARRHQVRAWRIFKPSHRLTISGKGAVVDWVENGTRRRVIGAEFRRRVLPCDIEVIERNILPPEKRRELTGATATPLEP